MMSNKKLAGFKNFDKINEIFGIRKHIKKSISNIGDKKVKSQLEDFADDYKKELKKYWDDFFDASQKYMDAKREYNLAQRNSRDKEIAKGKLDRADAYLHAVESHNSGLDELIRRRAKSLLKENPHLKDDFEEMLAEVSHESNETAKKKWKELTDRDVRKDGADSNKDYLFDLTDDDDDDDDDEEREKLKAKKEKERQKTQTLADLGIEDIKDFALEDDDKFWNAVDKMTKDNLKIVYRGIQAFRKEISTDIEEEVKELQAELKKYDGKLDAGSMSKTKQIKRDIIDTQKNSDNDIELLLDRLEEIKKKLDTQFTWSTR